MMKPIDRAIAKTELERINGALKAPHLLIGGLAVQQFHPARMSKDIDLVCGFETARTILVDLYPSRDWNVEDKHEDDYRPSYQITHKVEDRGTIIFGPKISERAPYSHIDFDALKKDAKPFRSARGELASILVPTAHALAYTKFVSFLGRTSPEHKVKADLIDFVDLANHPAFSLSEFYAMLRKTKAFDELRATFREKCKGYRQIVEQSSLFDVSLLFVSMQSANASESGSVVAASARATVYIAAPHKNVERNKAIKDALLYAGFDVKVPYEEVAGRRLKEGVSTPNAIRAVCIDAIKASHFVVVDLDTYGLDTAWELGYAEGLGRQVVGYNQDMFLTTDERHINRRAYSENFMHGWGCQSVYTDTASLVPVCRGKVVYIAGPFSNPQLESVVTDALTSSAKKVVFPKHYVENQKLLPKDYPLAERGETNQLLEDSEVVLVALPRYGMDCSWQIGYATAKGKTIMGIALEDDGVTLTRQSFWDHWMHAWKSKIRVTGTSELCSVLLGFWYTRLAAVTFDGKKVPLAF